MSELKTGLELVFSKDIEVLVEKGRHYGDSWKRRGGVGAFMMLARKWDRLENQAREHGWDVFELIRQSGAAADALDDIQDLRRYLALVELEMVGELQPPRVKLQPLEDSAEWAT